MTNLTTIVIFGASGDLTRRKLIPALFHLYRKKRLWERWRIVGVSRSPMSNEEFRQKMKEGVKEFARFDYDEEEWEAFEQGIQYVAGDLTQLEDLKQLNNMLVEGEGEGGLAHRMYYLSIAPRLYESALANLGAADMVSEETGWRRVVIEKPFGHDLASAKALNEGLRACFEEHQVAGPRVGHLGRCRPLRVRGARDGLAGRAVGVAGQPGAVEPAGRGARGHRRRGRPRRSWRGGRWRAAGRGPRRPRPARPRRCPRTFGRLGGRPRPSARRR